jgi:tetratricopeptide (TPR) repeat protein
MLHAFTGGLDTAAALEVATGITADAFDDQFADYVETEFGALLENMHDWRMQQEEAFNAVRNRNWAAAVTAAARAIELFPDYVDEGSPYIVKARGERESGAQPDARSTLAEYFERGGYDPEALNELAHWQKQDGDSAAAIEVLEALRFVAPLREQLHSDLGDWLREAGRPADALVEYEALLAMNPHDKATAYFRLAQVYLDLGEAERSREYLLYALEIAPHFREAQDMLLETLN